MLLCCCAEVMRWLMRPAGLDPSVYPAASVNLTDYNRVASNLGAAMAYAMQYAYQNRVRPDLLMVWQKHNSV